VTPLPRNVRAAAIFVIFAGVALGFVSLFDGPNLGLLAWGAMLVIAGLLLRIEAAILQITNPPSLEPDHPSRPRRLDPADGETTRSE
jgi:hypothetical protein